MWLSELLGETWAELADRLEAQDTLERWQRREPTLTSVARFGDLQRSTAAGADPRQSDAVIGALVRLAAVDGGGDQDATLTLLHLLHPGLTTLRRRLLTARVDEPEALVVGQATIQIRSFPWRRRTRAHAANILRDTGKALAREFAPIWDGRELLIDPHRYELLVDTVDATTLTDDEPELDDLLSWVQQHGSVDPRSVNMLLQYAAQRSFGGSAHARVAAARGISVRTCKRRCAEALAALRAGVPNYLAA